MKHRFDTIGFFCRSIDWFDLQKNSMASKITTKFLNSRPDENKIQSRTPNYFNRCSAPALSVYVSSILYYIYIGYHVLSQITHVVLSIEQWTHDARRSIEHGRLSHTATQDHWTMNKNNEQWKFGIYRDNPIYLLRDESSFRISGWRS